MSPSFTTTSTERHQGSVRSSDDLRDREGQHDVRRTNVRKPSRGRARPSRAAEEGGCRSAPAQLRRARSPARRKPRPSGTRATPIKRGGRLVWGLESDPAHVAPFGGILTANHWAKEFAYDSLVEWDRKLNVRPALAEKFEIINKTADPLDAEAGRQVPQRQGSDGGRRQVLGREDAQPAAAGQHLHRRPGAGDRQGAGRLEVRVHPAPEAARRPHHRLLRLAALCADRPGGLYDQINVSRNAIGTGPYRMLGYEPNDRIEYVRNANFWKKGFPYMDSMQLKILGDEQARVAALRAGAIDGATLSVEVAAVAGQQPRPDRAEGAERRVPRAADDDQAGRGQAVAQAGACGWRSTTRSTARTSSGGSTAARPSTRGTFRPATAPGR